MQIRRTSFRDAFDDSMQLLNQAETLLAVLRREGVLAQDRDFAAFIDVNRAALTRFRAARGQQLERHW